MVMLSNPNGLGLNARFFDCHRTIHGLEFRVVSDSPKIKILGLFLGSP